MASLGLALVLPWAGVLSLSEAAAAGLSLALVAWLGRRLSGFRRLGLELLLLPAAYVLTLTREADQRQLLLQFLLALATLAAVGLRPSGTWRAGEQALAVSVPLLAGLPLMANKFQLATAFSLALPLAGAAVPQGLLLPGMLVSWALCSPAHPGPLVGLLVGFLFLRRHPAWREEATRVVSRWAVPLAAAGLAGAVLLPHGGVLALPTPLLSWKAWLGLALSAVLSPFLPPAAAALTWTGLLWVALPLQPVPPDRPGPTLSAAKPQAALPAGTGCLYTVEVALAHAGSLPAGSPVATIRVGGETLTLRAGRDTAEWALLRADLRARSAHGLPAEPVFRPSTEAPWAVAGRVRLFVPAQVVPHLARDPSLPEAVVVTVLQAGPELPPPKRTVSGAVLLAVGSALVALFLPGFLSHPWLAAPFALLAASRLLLALPLQPLRILLERHGVDLALAGFLLAWALACRPFFRQRRWAIPALLWLLPLSLLAPQLSQLMGDEPYHLALAESLAADGDLDVTNNVDLERYPLWVVELPRQAGGRFLHSPALALLLFPGYLLAGRMGMVVGVGLLAWLALVALERRARHLGFPSWERFFALALTVFSYPLALFATELWPEMPAVAAVSWQLLWAGSGSFWPSAAVAVLATLIKTRLGLATVPLVAAAMAARLSSPRTRLLALVAAAVVAVLALILAALWFGNPLDPLGRRALSHLVPRDWHQPLRVVFGLAFDSAYGLAFAAPLWLLGLVGVPGLWRRGGWGERAAIGGAVLTLLALLAYVEWRGGASPPFRYLVPLLPVAFFGLLMTLRCPWGRALALVGLPPTLLVGWLALTRPAMLYNIGDGGHWLADRLAVRLAADVRRFFPSYLHPSLATYLAPPLVLGLWVGGAWVLAKKPRWRRVVSRQVLAPWLVAGSWLLVTARMLPDRVVELEAPQVLHQGGLLEPRPEAWSRFLYPNGWRLGNGDELSVPLKLAAHRPLVLVGWLEEGSGGGCRLAYRVEPAGPTGQLAVPAGWRGELPVAAAGPGRAQLTVSALCIGDSTVVLDRLEARR